MLTLKLTGIKNKTNENQNQSSLVLNHTFGSIPDILI